MHLGMFWWVCLFMFHPCCCWHCPSFMLHDDMWLCGTLPPTLVSQSCLSVRGHSSVFLPLLLSPSIPSVHMYIPNTSVLFPGTIPKVWQLLYLKVWWLTRCRLPKCHWLSTSPSACTSGALDEPQTHWDRDTTAPFTAMWVPIYGRLGTRRLGTGGLGTVQPKKIQSTQEGTTSPYQRICIQKHMLTPLPLFSKCLCLYTVIVTISTQNSAVLQGAPHNSFNTPKSSLSTQLHGPFTSLKRWSFVCQLISGLWLHSQLYPRMRLCFPRHVTASWVHSEWFS
jgi:hypothetical protein